MRRIQAVSISVLLGAAALASGQAPTTTSTGMTRPVTLPATLASGFKSDALAHFDDASKKIVDLAEAVPAEKYAWRPAAGVRSVSEVFVHVASGNGLLPTFLGAPRPEGMNREAEKTVTEKPKVLELLKSSIAHARAAIANVPDQDLDKKVKFFGRDVTERWIVLQMVSHAHEHLGQSIAYARMNGIKPPWSE